MAQGREWHSSMSVWQRLPSKPGWQSQVYSSIPSVQAPPLEHGVESHSFTSSAQSEPE